MVFTRRTTRKKFTRRTRRVSRSVKKYVRRAIDRTVEDKYRIIPLNTSAWSSINNAWKDISLESIQSGTAEGQRVGNRIRIKSIEIKGTLQGGQTGSAADDPFNSLRFVFAHWSGYNYTTPMASSGLNINSVINKDTAKQLQRKYVDRFMTLTAPNPLTVGYQPAVRVFKWYHRFARPIVITYSDINTVNANSCLALSVISDSAAIPNPGFINGFAKVVYEDA